MWPCPRPPFCSTAIAGVRPPGRNILLPAGGVPPAVPPPSPGTGRAARLRSVRENPFWAAPRESAAHSGEAPGAGSVCPRRGGICHCTAVAMPVRRRDGRARVRGSRAERHAGAIDLDQHVVGQVGKRVHVHHELTKNPAAVDQATPIRPAAPRVRARPARRIQGISISKSRHGRVLPANRARSRAAGADGRTRTSARRAGGGQRLVQAPQPCGLRITAITSEQFIAAVAAQGDGHVAASHFAQQPGRNLGGVGERLIPVARQFGNHGEGLAGVTQRSVCSVRGVPRRPGRGALHRGFSRRTRY